jgi:hypothetical protein
MTRKLSELFNLPDQLPDNATAEQAETVTQEHQKIFKEIDSTIDKIDSALPLVKDLDSSDDELDELANLAKDKFNDLMELGLNMEARFSGQVFQTAGILLGHAISAKQAKLDKKLRMVDLQLKKMKLDHQIKQDGGDASSAIEGEGIILDRNSLLDQILNKPKQ